jgi:hypothetical protein
MVFNLETARKALEAAEAEYEAAARQLAADEQILTAAKDRLAREWSVAGSNAAHSAARVAARSRARLALAEEKLRAAEKAVRMLDIEDRAQAGADVTVAEALEHARWSRERQAAADPDRTERIAALNTLRSRYAIQGRMLTLHEASKLPQFAQYRDLIDELIRDEETASANANEIAERLHGRLRGGE